MKLPDIARLRLVSQHLVHQKFKKPEQVVGWMGAMQAQDAEMAKWAIGVRLAKTTVRSVEASLDKGKILRTHLLRPTWHLVAAEDIHWMLELTAPQIRTAMGARHRQLGLTSAAEAKCLSVIERTLNDGRPRMRGELVTALRTAGYRTEDNRMAHLMMLAELEGVMCSGPSVGGKTTYALLDERVRKPKRLSRDEALATLAARYFASHGPATARDLAWWSGLKAADARAAIEMVRMDLSSSIVDGQTYWYSAGLKDRAAEADKIRLLPAYDEFTISYSDRSALIVDRHRTKAISSNGIFRPLIMIGGEVVGIWRRRRSKDGVNVDVSLFAAPPAGVQKALEAAVAQHGEFLDTKVSLTVSSARSWTA